VVCFLFAGVAAAGTSLAVCFLFAGVTAAGTSLAVVCFLFVGVNAFGVGGGELSASLRFFTEDTGISFFFISFSFASIYGLPLIDLK